MIPAASESPSGARARSRWVGAARASLLAAAALGVSWGAAVAWANSPSIKARLRAEAERALRQRLPNATLGEGVAVDLLGHLQLGALTVPASRPGLAPVLRVERLAVSPRWVALLAGRAEPAAVSLSGVRLEAGAGGEELSALARRLPASARPASRPLPASGVAPPEVRFQDLVLAIAPSGERLEFGPLAGAVEARREEVRVRLELPSGGRASAVLGGRGGRTELRLTVEEAGFQDLPEALRRRLPFAVARGHLWATLESPDAARGGSLSARVRKLDFFGGRLGPDLLGPFDLAFHSEVAWGEAERRAAVERGALALGPRGEVAVALSASVELRDDPTFFLELRAEGVEWSALAAALPPPLVPEEARRLSGPLGARLALAGPVARPGEWRVEAELDLKALRRAAQGADPFGLAGEFDWRPPAGGRPLRVGPDNPDFVPLADLPQHVVRAITTAEDGGFFAHAGFDFEEIRNALAERAESGRVRGASTITQQLAKNLFLSGERTLSRKVREALLTVALEASLPKARLLEIYLNVVEWGPGLHGIGPAARHYFGKDARQLTPREAAFLASVIPSPARFHALYERGDIPESWLERIDAILIRMAAFGQLDQDQLLEALQQPLVFAHG